jgi:hypothetical protein
VLPLDMDKDKVTVKEFQNENTIKDVNYEFDFISPVFDFLTIDL